MTNQSNDEISLLDIAVFLAEHWMVIFLLPLILAVVTYFISAQIEHDYTATATIVFPEIPEREEASLIETMVADVTRQAVRASGSDGLIITTHPASMTLTATARTEDGAIEITRDGAASISDTAMQSIEASQERVNRIGGYVGQMEAAIASSDVDSINPQAIAAAATLRMQYDFDAADVDQARGWAESLRTVDPDIRANGRSPWFYAIATLLVSGMLSLIICGLRVGWTAARQNPASREKLARIRAAFGMPSDG